MNQTAAVKDTVIQVRGLGKKYKLGMTLSHDTLRDHIAHSAKRLLTLVRTGKGTWLSEDGQIQGCLPSIEKKKEFWALKDISFEVKRGEILGVIGLNGAGKSTLLKILSKITEPTEGEVRYTGRVGSLLEVGTGMHPELSGKENVYLNGAILGMTKREIDNKYYEIIEFADILDFMDTPIKRYSSGMRVRLGFAIAAHLEPEILIVDEVLAVGDAKFQEKCLEKIGDTSRAGKTVLLVSHNMNAIYNICTRAILLEGGELIADGDVKEVVTEYLSIGSSDSEIDLDKLPHRGLGRYARLINLILLNKEGKPSTVFNMNDPLTAQIKVECREFMKDAVVGLVINNQNGKCIHMIASSWEGHQYDLQPGNYTVDIRISNILLLPAKYQIGAWIRREGEWTDDHLPLITLFEVNLGDLIRMPTKIEKYGLTGNEVYTPSEWKLTAG